MPARRAARRRASATTARNRSAYARRLVADEVGGETLDQLVDGLGSSESAGDRPPRSTASGSSAHARPQRNAAWFVSTATPLSAMARSIASVATGTAPIWTATPSTMMLPWSSTRAVRRRARRRRAGGCRPLGTRRSPGPSAPPSTVRRGRDGSPSRRSGRPRWTRPPRCGRLGVGEAVVARRDEQVERQQTVDTRDVRVIRRHGVARRDPHVAHHRDRPSATGRSGRDRGRCSPSSIAAVPRIWLTVTTPVPPMPTMRTVKSSASTIGSAGSGTSAGTVPGHACGRGRRRSPSRTTGSRPRGTRSRGCSWSGRCGSCGRTACRPAAPTGSCSCRRSRRTPRTPAR